MDFEVPESDMYLAGTIEFRNKCIPASEFVVLKVLNRNNNLNMGGILLPQSTCQNERVGFYQIEAVGKKAAEEYGLSVGEYVVADRLAQCYNTSPIAVMKYTNIIAKTNEDNSKFQPLKNMVFVQDEVNRVNDVKGILVRGYNKKLNIGKIVSMNIDKDIEVPFKVGDNVMLTKGGDSFDIGATHIFIYKYDSIACVVEDK